MNVINVQNCTLKVAKMIIFMLYIFHHNKNSLKSSKNVGEENNKSTWILQRKQKNKGTKNKQNRWKSKNY